MGVVLNTCASILLSDFFCARSVGSGTYGGRLFVMENALVFVST